MCNLRVKQSVEYYREQNNEEMEVSMDESEIIDLENNENEVENDQPNTSYPI